jgi:hypothetical protein
MDRAVQKRAHRENDDRCLELESELGSHTGQASAFNNKVFYALLKKHQQRRRVDNLPRSGAIERAVNLRPRRLNCRPLAGIQDPEVNAALIRTLRHKPTERIDLLDQVSLTDPTNGGIAGHLPERF